MTTSDFARQVIKGRIAETIFEFMFRESGKLTVLPIGYEHTMPELAQYQDHVQMKKVLENIRNAPDFALITQDKSQVYLVETKFRRTLEKEHIVTLAQEMNTYWNPCYLFLATPDGFFYSPCNTILNTSSIQRMPEEWISHSIQDIYLKLLMEFII